MPHSPDLASQDPEAAAPLAQGHRKDLADSVRPILQALARVIVTDRRAVVLANLKGEILLANQSAQQLNIEQGELLARLDWPDICARVRRAGSMPAVWQQGEQSYEGEVVHVPLGPAEGYMLRLSESDQESTWLRNRARAAMLTRVAHDLRTPIQSLLASADSLTQRTENVAQTRNNAGIRRAAELALDHITNVLGVIRGEQNLKGGQPDEDFRIAEEVTGLIAMVEPIAHARATEVNLSVDAPADLTLRGPIRFVRALCQNLIDNSVNHGGGRVDLRLSCAPLGSALVTDDPQGEVWRVRLELRDEGGGLPAAQRARLAEALGLPMDATGPQVSAGTKRPSAGLNVLAHALRQLGGRITIEDRGSDGKPLAPGSNGRVIGTIFTVTFSLPRVADPHPAPTAERRADQTPLAGRTILLVEDSPSSRDWLAHVLQAAGAEVHLAGSGAEALALVSRNEFATKVDLVLTDVTLPRMNGIELAAKLRAGDPASAITWRGKVVGLTAHADDRIRTACLQAGMTSVLEKPIQPHHLCSCLAGILDGVPQNAIREATPRPAMAAIDTKVVTDLIGQMGIETTRTFMHRALSEARSVLDELLTEGVGPDTGRRLHAATGASGLTGLRLVEKHLRQIELSIERSRADLVPLYDALADALDRTNQKIEELVA